MKRALLLCILFLSSPIFGQSWSDVGGGTNSSSHGLLTWDDKLINLGSFNSPCARVAEWDGTSWNCLGGGVGIVARAGVVWDGKLVVVGDFWNVHQPCVGCNGVAVWDGVSWSPLGDGVNNDVLVCTVWQNQLVIGGDFTEASGVPSSRIVKWNGTVWESIGPTSPTTFSNDIRSMVEFDGDLYVGGDFNNVGGCTACDGLVKYDPATNSWVGGDVGVDIVGGVDYSVRVLYVNPSDGNLYMGGEFPEIWDGDAAAADPNMSGIAMYDGSNWTPLGTGLNEYVRAIHEYNGDVIAGGYFTNAGGVPANKIAKWDPATSTWSAMGLGFDGGGVDEYVKSATTWNGIFFAGGAYTQCEGNPMDFIAQWYEAPTEEPVAWMSASATSLCGSGCIDFLDNSTSAPTSWNWSFPGSDVPTSTAQNPGSVCYSTPGTYTVTLQACNSIGCNTQEIEIEVSAGASVSVSNQAVCDGVPAVLNAVPDVGGGTYLWSTGATTNSITVTPGTTTTYTVTYTLAGCTAGTETATVTVGTTPTVSVATTTPVICAGSSAAITATPSVGGGTYDWTPGSGSGASISPNPPATTTYTVTYSLAGCESAPDTVTIFVNPAPAVTAANAAICAGESTTITAIPTPSGGTFLWSPGGATSSSITVSPAVTTNYSVVYTLGGCSSPADISTVTVNPSPITSVSQAMNVFTADQSGAGYQWLDCNAGFAAISGETSQSFTALSAGTYAVQINLGGCIDTSTCIILLSTGINETGNSNVAIYPNPTTGLIYVTAPNSAGLDYTITDILGKVVSSGKLIAKTSSIDISGLSDGLYFFKAGKESQHTIKIIKR